MKASRFRVGTALISSAAVAAFGLSAFTPALSAQNVTPPPGAVVNTIKIKGPGGGLRFDGPTTAVAGSYLRIVNKTNPHQVGPHTFSLVTKSSLPKTKNARKKCFTPNHICKAIAKWHGTNGNGPITKNPAEAGAPGWDTLGSVSKKGDSWFTGNKPGTEITQQLSADTSAGPVTLYYQCAIHPFMHGSVTVTPPTP
jgi:hypothetical protein